MPTKQQQVLILVGLPGSGKSTIAEQLSKQGWCVVNQDSLGSRTACITMMKIALVAGQNVVVDRCNVNPKQREPWLELAARYKVPATAVIVRGTPTECVQRVMGRVDHPNLNSKTEYDKIREVVYGFHKSYIEPSTKEGFSCIVYDYPFEREPSSAPVA